MSKILNPSQAKAVYDALCAMNNVSTHSGTEISFVGAGDDGEPHRFTLSENAWGQVRIIRGASVRPSPSNASERYESQAAFVAAYGLNPDG